MSRDYQGPHYSLNDLRSVIDAMCKSIESSGLIDEHEHPSAYSALLDTSKWMAELEGQEPVAWQHRNGWVPLYARPVPAEPVNVDFGKRGENMFFKIGNQSFLLDYKPEEQDEFDFMKAMLLSAFSRITRGVKTEIQPVNARLLSAAKKWVADCAEFGFADDEAPLLPEFRAAIAAAEAQQERALQDMHDAGREIDRVMAEPAPKAARLTLDELDAAAKDGGKTNWVTLFQRIETAVLRKNGIEVAE